MTYTTDLISALRALVAAVDSDSPDIKGDLAYARAVLAHADNGDTPRATWFELSARLYKGGRVRFAEDFDIFPHCVVPSGTECIVTDMGLNEITGNLNLLPDDEAIRAALAAWGGEIRIFPANLAAAAGADEDDAYQGESPLEIITTGK